MAKEQPSRDGLPFKHVGARSYHPDNGIFHLQFESEESRLGMCFQGYPLLGADERTMGQLISVLSSNLPPGTFVQFGLFVDPDVSDNLYKYITNKTTKSNILQKVALRRAEFIGEGVNTPIDGMNGVHLNRQRLLVSVSILCDEIPTVAQEAKISEIGSRMKEGLNSANLGLSRMDEKQYLALLRRFYHMYNHDDFEIDDYTPLREQVFSVADAFNDMDDHLDFNDGEYFSKSISVKHLPRRAHIGLMNMLLGDPFGSRNQITTPYYLSVNLHFPDQREKSAEIRRKHLWVTQQSSSPISGLIPRLASKKQGMDVMLHEMDVGGATLCEYNLTMTLFSKDKEELVGAAATFTSWAGSIQFNMKEDRRILKMLFHTNLPMNASVEGIKESYRYNTLAVTHATRLLPLLGDWTGTGMGASSIFTNRRGATSLFDPYDSSTNYNGFVIAESGAGKSVLLQQFICDWMGSGARVWVIDQGRSYEKLCAMLKGQYIEFSRESKICLNPFTHVIDIDEDMAMLKSIFAKMAAPTDGLDDYRMAALEAKIKSTFEDKGNKANVTSVAEQCLDDPDIRIKDIGKQLYPFTRNGSFGSWFDGVNNIDLTNDFVVMELQELQSMPMLQQVILIQLFSSISHEMYKEGEGRKKMLLCDEAKQLIDDPVISPALDAFYQKVRKYRGSAWMAVQNIGYLLNSPNGVSMLGNSAWQIILQQKIESVEQAIKNGGMNIDSYQEAMLKSVHTTPGKYSEMMIRNDANYGVVRFVADRFSQILFSTKGWERDEVFRRMRQGEDIVHIIEGYVSEGK